MLYSQRAVLAAGAICLLIAGCTIKGGNPNLDEQDVRLTVLHTADFHSRLIKYRFSPGFNDVQLGLIPDLSEEYGVGGIDRIAYLIARERAEGQRVIHVDSGDEFQGAPIYNIWKGEPEMRAMAQLGVDAQAVGNHEFDSGATIFAHHAEDYATYPLLAANYLFEDDTKEWTNTLNRVVQPWTIINKQGLRIALIGMGNLSSLNSLTEQGNSLGITPLETIEATQLAVDQVRDISDVIIVISHLGLDEDEQIAKNVTGVDAIMGGHLHIVLNPPNVVKDPDGRDVIIAHSGAFEKYMGRLDLVLRKPSDPELAKKYGFEVVSHKYELFPIDKRVDDEINKENKSPHEIEAAHAVALMRELMEPYKVEMAQLLDLNQTVGCASVDRIPRFGTSNGDSVLGNMVAEALQTHDRIRADFAITNSTGIRSDFLGKIQDDERYACYDENNQKVYSYNLDELYNILPFDNTITTMFLSGTEVQELFDYIASRSAERGCSAQAQISGATVTLVCRGDEHFDYPHADNIEIGGVAINPNGTYELATNNYIAGGGSGYEVLKRNTTQVDSFIPMREAVSEYMGITGIVPCNKDGSQYPSCGGDADKAGMEDGRIQMRF